MTKVTNVSMTTRIENGARRFITDLGMGDALLPVILLEASVTGGRTYQAYKRGGFVEARERATEETLGAIFWLFGVTAFSKMGDKLGEKIFGFKDINFDVGKDVVRNPLVNYVHTHKQYNTKILAAFKFGKIITSILLANAIIGFVVPKINQAITRKYQKSLEQMDERRKTKPAQNPPANASQTVTNGDSFEATNNNPDQTPFKGNYVQTLLSLTDKFENDANYKLLSTDVGIAGGRAINARNKYERNEILVRDVGSIYFYLWCRTHVNDILNLFEDGKWSRLNAVSTQQLDEHVQGHFSQDFYTTEEFEKLVFGDKDAKIPAEIQAKIKEGIVKLEDIRTLVDAETFKRAQAMSKLQPELEGHPILTEAQIQDVYTKGLINDPEFLSRVYEKYTKGKSANPLRFVPEGSLRKLKQEMVEYLELIVKNAKKKGEKITIRTLKRANKANFVKNGINLVAGFAVAATFLSTIIPKIQYKMTLKRTGENKFPGVQKYDK